ncbi:fatty acid desaturase [Leptolyngbya sp. FACHB-261]|uniref:acyl-CoA desaturase n=1 Tax=Leptolyngbya sp. FACHB-261 TaxID=2692806 RepID=UPI001689594E|nr:fatty acid desaturase [Leptolyngbya sp. FACHB-261]MBD2103675.1 fatty acid desaturase [Leptolyngbya sp. FACHB-261]
MAFNADILSAPNSSQEKAGETTASVQRPPTELRLNWVNVAFFGAVHLVALSAPWFFSWKAVGVMLVLHWLFGSVGICLGYHRLLSHRSLQVPRPVEYFLALIGALAAQGGPIFWVGGHRQHHGFTEHEDHDPYSSTRGFWWSHMGWILYSRPEHFDPQNYFRFAPDLARDPIYRFMDKWFLAFQIPLGLALYAFGGWPCVIWGGVMRAILLWHSTWLINSASHKWGYRNFQSTDNSRNLWWAALLTYGEGWHNNHHTYPNMAKAGLHWWEVDVTWWSIQALRKLGLVQKITLPKADWREQLVKN